MCSLRFLSALRVSAVNLHLPGAYVPNTALMVASSDEHFREMVRDNLLNMPEAKIVAEYREVTANLYIRVLQDLERHPNAGLIVDLSGDPEGAIKAIEKVKQ